MTQHFDIGMFKSNTFLKNFYAIKFHVTGLSFKHCHWSVFYRFNAAKRESKRYKIPTLSRNVMNINDNMKVVWLVGTNSIVEQLFNIVLEYFYAEMGADGIFSIWWTYQLVMFVQLYLFLPGVLIWNAYKKTPDFNGVKAKPFPGQEKPRNLQLLPRREEFYQHVSNREKYSETRMRNMSINTHKNNRQ